MCELKPCPFCGSEHVVCTKPTTWQVWCTDCKCIGPWKTERKDAIEAWNRRAGEQDG
jgi:Lar family restriction alleviation protein